MKVSFTSRKTIVFASMMFFSHVGVVYARKSKETKEAERAAYWGVFADVYRANTYLIEQGSDVSRVEQSLNFAAEHLRSVDQTAAPSFLALGAKLSEISATLRGRDLKLAKARLLDIERGLIADYAAHIAPVIPPDFQRGQHLFQEYCSGCHGDGQSETGKLARHLKVPPRSLADARAREHSKPFGVYAIGIHGVDQSEMTSMLDVIDLDQLWSIAFYTAAIGYSEDEEGPPGFWDWLNHHRSEFSLSTLAVFSDEDLRVRLSQLGWVCGSCDKEVAVIRRRWAFSGAVNRLGDVALTPREATEHRALILLLLSVAVVSALFVFVLRSRR